MTDQDKAFFTRSIEQLKSLKDDQQPLWGIMTPQHVVEHLVGSWRISNGRARVPQKLSDEEVEKRRSFLFSNQVYPRNIANPTVKEQGNAPLLKESLEAAIDQLEDEIAAFFDYHKQTPNAQEMHPVFGALDANGWLIFQTKHMTHHMTQFGLM